jgi:hypothetical protein
VPFSGHLRRVVIMLAQKRLSICSKRPVPPETYLRKVDPSVTTWNGIGNLSNNVGSSARRTGHLLHRVQVIIVFVAKPSKGSNSESQYQRDSHGSFRFCRRTHWSVPLSAPYLASPIYCRLRHQYFQPPRWMLWMVRQRDTIAVGVVRNYAK